MYTGTNPTALQSQNWLADSLVELMGEKPYDKITIRDLCERSQLSRQTFYNLFASKDEVLHFYLQVRWQAEFARYADALSLTIEQVVDAFTAVITQNETQLKVMLDNGLDAIVAEEIGRCVTLFAERFVTEGRRDDLLPYSEALLSGALAQLLVHWIRDESPVSADRLVTLLEDFFRGELFELS